MSNNELKQITEELDKFIELYQNKPVIASVRYHRKQYYKGIFLGVNSRGIFLEENNKAIFLSWEAIYILESQGENGKNEIIETEKLNQDIKLPKLTGFKVNLIPIDLESIINDDKN